MNTPRFQSDMSTRTTRYITSLRENEVFVFGSNESGMHGGGNALLARERFGAKIGVAEGMQGSS